jgi:TonB family protein
MRELLFVVAFFWWLPGIQQSMEKQALAVAQRVPVNDLDRALPSSPFSSWFEGVVGQKSGVIWQLGECGQPIIDPTLASTQDSAQDSAQLESGDIPACVEANAVLPDGRKVVVMIRVGSFKKGITENPGFNFAMIEQQGALYLIKRLSDLPGRLRALTTPEGRRAWANLPEVKTTFGLVRGNALGSGMQGIIQGIMKNGGLLATSFDAGPPPPPPPSPDMSPIPSTNGSSKIVGGEEQSLGAVSWGDAITKVQPRYPPAAKRMNASGTVEVKITISEFGRVIEARAISGPPLLRDAAEDAARQWVFKPTTLKGSPMATQQILTFVFKAPQ